MNEGSTGHHPRIDSSKPSSHQQHGGQTVSSSSTSGYPSKLTSSTYPGVSHPSSSVLSSSSLHPSSALYLPQRGNMDVKMEGLPGLAGNFMSPRGQMAHLSHSDPSHLFGSGMGSSHHYGDMRLPYGLVGAAHHVQTHPSLHGMVGDTGMNSIHHTDEEVWRLLLGESAAVPEGSSSSSSYPGQSPLSSTDSTQPTVSTINASSLLARRGRSRNPFETEEEKLLRKRERKRESVRRSRQRKQDRLEELEARTKELEKERQELLQTLKDKGKDTASSPLSLSEDKEKKTKDENSEDEGASRRTDSDDSASDGPSFKRSKTSKSTKGSSGKESSANLVKQRRAKEIEVIAHALDTLNASGFEDFAAIAEKVYAENVRLIHPDVDEEVIGRVNVVNYWKKLLEAFPDATMEHEVTAESGDETGLLVRVAWAFVGTHVEGIFGILPTNKKIRVKGHSLVTFDPTGTTITKQLTVWNHGHLIMELLGIPIINT